LYELGVQLYQAVEGGSAKTIDRARRNVLGAIEMAHRGPLMLGGPEDDEAIMTIHHFVHGLDRFVQARKRTGKSDAQAAGQGE
jgi:hypothetical protein